MKIESGAKPIEHGGRPIDGRRAEPPLGKKERKVVGETPGSLLGADGHRSGYRRTSARVSPAGRPCACARAHGLDGCEITATGTLVDTA